MGFLDGVSYNKANSTDIDPIKEINKIAGTNEFDFSRMALEALDDEIKAVDRALKIAKAFIVAGVACVGISAFTLLKKCK